MDGSRFVPNIGVPSRSTSLSITNEGNLVSILPFNNNGFLAATNAKEIFFGTDTSAKFFAASKDENVIGNLSRPDEITNILSDKNSIYVVHFSGKIDAFDTNGKLRWQWSDNSMVGEVNFGSAILADTDLIITGKTIGGSYPLFAIDIHNGKEIPWGGIQGDPYRSLVFDAAHDIVFGAFDSVLEGDRLYGDGECIMYHVFQQRFHHQELRIISNICLCGKTDGKIIDKIAFGYLSKRPGSDERTMNVGIFSISRSSTGYTLEKLSSHEVPYLPINIASNGPVVLSSGFYDSGTELTSGIDAFYADDTTKLWQRRFTYPLAAPVAISEKYAYFTLTFSTQAAVPAQSIFYTLELSTGKTLGELPVTGAHTGFAPGIPMPFGESGFMLADKEKPIIYFLKP